MGSSGAESRRVGTSSSGRDICAWVKMRVAWLGGMAMDGDEGTMWLGWNFGGRCEVIGMVLFDGEEVGVVFLWEWGVETMFGLFQGGRIIEFGMNRGVGMRIGTRYNFVWSTYHFVAEGMDCTYLRVMMFLLIAGILAGDLGCEIRSFGDSFSRPFGGDTRSKVVLEGKGSRVGTFVLEQNF